MLYFSRLKTASILGVCLLGILLCLPNLMAAPASWMPWRKVRLGLDLQGGSYLLMQVDMNAVVKERLNGIVDQARGALLKGNIGYTRLMAQPAQDRVLVRLLKPAQRTAALAALQPLAANTGAPGSLPELTLGGTSPDILLTLSQAALAQRATAAVQQSIEIVRRRIDGTGVVDPQISRQGTDKIVVQLPGISDPNHVKRLIGKTAKMTFHLLDESASPNGPAPFGDTILPLQGTPGSKLVVRNHVQVDGSTLTNAQAGQDPQTGQWVVNFTFDSVGAREFASVTRANVGHPFAIVLDNQVISAPVIREPITGGQGQISGDFTAAQATDLALLLRAGALPAPLKVIEERSVGPELGADSIRAGAISLAVGFVLVIGFMAAFYGLFGWFANLALVVNLILMMAILSLLQATLTLPGMAGILLTLGMAVDANILINERVREEVKHGRKPLDALEHGYRRAYGTIVDSNMTTLLAHVMLFIFGSGPVKGFAVTITVGIVTTLFTATVVARLFTARWYVARRPVALPV
ncbi:MAG TPA: protein translocase subunit SecD [Acetobacteraceae bacterium]|nr:protein translocase subunit SecD [Acetobacteraceae bacterium]